MFKEISKGNFASSNCRTSRHKNLATVKFHRVTHTQHAFSYTGPSTWNALPEYLRIIESFPLYKKYYFDQYFDHIQNS